MCLPKHLKLLPKKHTFCLGVINPSWKEQSANNSKILDWIAESYMRITESQSHKFSVTLFKK